MANEILRFLIELLAVAIYAYGALQLAEGPIRLALAAAAVLAAVAYWGVLVAPKSTRRLPDPQRLVAELAFFAGAAVTLAVTGLIIAGSLVGALAAVNALSLRYHGSELGALG